MSDGKTEDEIYWRHIINQIINHLGSDFVYFLDKDGHLQDCNESFKKTFDISSIDDFKNKPYAKIAKVFGLSDTSINKLRLCDANVTFSKQFVMDSIDTKSNDSAIKPHYQCEHFPITGTKDEVVGILVQMTAISEEKAVEAQKNQAKGDGVKLGFSPRVMVVEDDETYRDLLKSFFENQGCTVDVVDSLDKAVSLFKLRNYDLISMDLKLENKGTSGHVITKNFRLSENGTNQHVPIVVITGFTYSEGLENDLDYYQVDGCLVKPVSEEQIGQLLRYFVGHENITVKGLHINPTLLEKRKTQ